MMESDLRPALPADPPPLPVPPVVPPPLPGPPAAAAVLEGRLHPFTLFFTLYHAIRSVFVPLIIVLFFGSKKGESGFLFWLLFLVGGSVLYSLVRYFTFTYRIENGELITKHGLLGRMERKIPLDRIQDVRLEQRVAHRLFRVVEVQVETAGGKGAEAALSVLSLAEAERLREGIFAGSHRAIPAAGAGAAAQPERTAVRRLAWWELALGGMTTNYITSALLLLLVLWNQLDDLLPEHVFERLLQGIAHTLSRFVEHSGSQSLAVVLAGVLLLLVIGLLASTLGSIILFFGFTLSRQGEDLQRAYGLFTRRSSTLPRRRIQVLTIEESWLRRLFTLATVRADSAGSNHGGQARHGGRDALLPIIWRKELDGLLPVFLPGLDAAEDPWRPVSRRAIRRGTVKGALVCLLLAAAAFFWRAHAPWLWLLPLALVSAVYYLNVLNFRYLGFRAGRQFFWTRHGWLSRTTCIVPIRNLQAVVIRQNPLDRWHKVARVLVDTAGQAFTGGGPHISNVHQEEALAMARALAQQAAQTRFELH